jgi:predicted PurR-regulated permease PerM
VAGSLQHSASDRSGRIQTQTNVEVNAMARPFSPQWLGRVLVVAVLVLLAIWTLWNFLPALGWAAVLATATWPVREWQVRNSATPTAAAISLTLVIGLLIIGPLFVLLFEGAREAILVVHWLRELRETGLGTPEWLPTVPGVGGAAAAWWQDHLGSAEAAREFLGRSESAGLLQWTRHLGRELIHRTIILGFTLLTLFFLYRNGPQLIAQAHIIGDRLLGEPAKRYGSEALATVRGTVNGLVLVGLAEGAVLGFAYVAAGLTHPLLLGFATGVLATVPFGAPLVYVISCMILVMQSRPTAAVLLFLFASAVVFLADHFVRPALIGRSTRLPFLWVLLGIFGGLETFGLLGLFLGPAIVAVVLAVWREGAKPAVDFADAQSGLHVRP